MAGYLDDLFYRPAASLGGFSPSQVGPNPGAAYQPARSLGGFPPAMVGPTAQPRPAGNVLGDTTIRPPGGGGSPSLPALPPSDFGQQSAEDQRLRDLDVVRQRLEAFKARAAGERQGAQQRATNFVNSAKSRFGTLRDTLANTVSTGLERLGQEKVGVQNLYGRAAGTVRGALEGALRGNRMQARAQNRLNSSFYDDAQAGTRQTFGNQLADTATEEAGKLAGIGTRETETKNYGDTERQNLDREEADLVTQAEEQLNADLREAEQLERAGLIDYAQGESQILANHASRLDSIRNYIDNRNLRLMELAGAYGTRFSGFEAIDPRLAQTLAANQGLTGAQNLASTVATPGVATGAGATNALAMRGSPLENRRRDIELGLAFG